MTVRVKQNFAALLTGRNLMGYYLVPHLLHLPVTQHADDPGPVNSARVDGAHNFQVFLGDVSVRIVP